MGYYSSLETDARINKKLLSKLKESMANYKDGEHTNVIGCWFEDIDLTENNEGIIYLSFNDMYSKWYDDDEFINFIQPFLDYDFQESYDFKFYGEDNETWGYRVYKDKIIYLTQEWKEV